MCGRDDVNRFANPDLAGAADGHGLPAGWSLAPYSHGVHYWKIPVPVEAHAEVMAGEGPAGATTLRVKHQVFRLLDAWDDYLPEPGQVHWVGIRAELAGIEPADEPRVFRLIYHGRAEGSGYVHTRIRGARLQNDPESIAWQKDWRRIDHAFILDAGDTLDGVWFYVKVSERGDLVELSGFSLTCEGVFRPKRLRPKSRLRELPEPNERTVVHVNPPAFAWPGSPGAGRYDLEIAPVDDFSRDVIAVSGLNLNFHKPAALLAPGQHYWRRRETGGDWLTPVAFTVPDDCAEWVTPTFDEVFANLRPEHPRLYVTRETLDDLRRTVTVDNAASWRNFLASIDKPVHQRHRRRGRRRGPGKDWRIAVDAYRLWNHAFAWLITGERAQAKRSRELLAKLLALPFEGITRHRHSELNRDIVIALAVTYDWLHDVLTDDERVRTREALARRIGDIHDHYHANGDPWHSYEVFRYDSHGTYMMQTVLFGALAIAGEVPEARAWMEYWLTANVCFYPPWSETDGSWAQGVGYCSPYVENNDIPEAWAVRSATGLDLFGKPFFRNHAAFMLYSYPPFGLKAIFGDLGGKDDLHNNDLTRYTRVAGVLAAELNDPYAAWYARVGETEHEFQRPRSLFVPQRVVAPKPPTDLPLAKCFPDTGWALLHTDLTGARDVFFAFKSSPFGSMSHSHADQNSFTLSVGDRRLLTDSGYYAGYGTPHHLGWYKHSKAHNTVLVNGRGQLVNCVKSAGHVTHFAHTGEIDYVVGDAQAAYGVLLDRFDRHVVFLRPSLFVIFDDLAAVEPATFDWLLHAAQPMTLDAAARTIETQNGPYFARVHLDAPEALSLSMTDRFDPAPPERVSSWNNEYYRNEYHFAARTETPSTGARFLALIGVGEFVRNEDLPAPTFFETGAWKGVWTREGGACFRIGEGTTLSLGGREIETDANAFVLRPSGAWLAADCRRLKIDGEVVIDSEDAAKVQSGRVS